MKKILMIVMVVMIMFTGMFVLTGCTEADKVEYNVSKEADNFNVVRRVVVINCATDKPIFEIIGRISINDESSEEGGRQLEIIMQTGKNKYKKHMIGLNDMTTTYVVEDMYGAEVNNYKYEINYQPKSIIPYDVVQMD